MRREYKILAILITALAFSLGLFIAINLSHTATKTKVETELLNRNNVMIAAKILKEKTANNQEESTTNPEDQKKMVEDFIVEDELGDLIAWSEWTAWIDSLSTEELIDNTIAGNFGLSDTEIKESLRDRYEEAVTGIEARKASEQEVIAESLAETEKTEAELAESEPFQTEEYKVETLETKQQETEISYEESEKTTTADTEEISDEEVEYTESETEPETELIEEVSEENYTGWSGSVLTPSNGVNWGPTGFETYYNLDMSGLIDAMYHGWAYYDCINKDLIDGILETGGYWVRSDGVKMFGDYVIVAANLAHFPRGSIVESSLGTAIVLDTGGFASMGDRGWSQLDIAVNW